MNRRGGGRCRRAQRTYRLLVRLYPAAHRRAFGEPMVQTFGDHYRDVVEHHGGSRLRFWAAVLADTASSVLSEHAAELRARGGLLRGRRARRGAFGGRRARRGALGERRAYGRAARRDRWPRPAGRRRTGRVRRRLRYRPARVFVRLWQLQVVYRGRLAALAVLLVLVGGGLGAGAATGHLGLAALLSGLLVVAWLGYGIRLAHRVPAGPHGNGPAPPGGAGVREPRRPLPLSPAGSAAMPRPDQEPPGQAVAMI